MRYRMALTAAQKREVERLKEEEASKPDALFADVVRVVKRAPEGPVETPKKRRATTKRQ